MLVGSQKKDYENPGGGNSVGKVQKWIAVVGAVAIIGILVVDGGGIVIQFKELSEKRTISRNKCRAVAAILSSRYRCMHDVIDHYVDRVEVRKRLMKALSRESKFVSTMIVCGPRGSGKSTLVAEIFDKIPAVVKLSYNGNSEDEFANAIFGSLEILCPITMPPTSFLMAVLKEIRAQGHQLPTLVIEVDKRFYGPHLENLLLTCKRLGDDLKLVAPVVVLSSSRAAFGMHINPGDLRAKFLEVDDLSEVEARSLLFKALEKVEGSHDMKKNAVDLRSYIRNWHQTGAFAQHCK